MIGLQGRSVVNTRAPHQSAALDTLLRQYGAEPLSFPCIEIAPPDDPATLDDALRLAANGHYQGLILTSVNTVIALETRLKQLALAASALASLKVAAIGPATAEEATNRLGVRIDVMPDEYISDALLDALMRDPALAGAAAARLLLPQSEIADTALAERLRQHGAQVVVVPAYRTVRGSGGVNLPELLQRGAVDAITFTSGSTVSNCCARLNNESRHRNPLAGVTVACIGPKTADAAREFGLTACIVPIEYTLEALVAALDAHFRSPDSGVPRHVR